MENNSQTQSRKAVWVALLTVIVIVAAVAAFPIRLLINSAYEHKDKLEVNKMDLDAIKHDSSQLEQYRKLTEEIIINKGLIDNSDITKESLVSFIRDIENIAKLSGNSIVISSYEPPVKRKAAPSDTEASKSSNSSDGASKEQGSPAKNEDFLIFNLNGDYVDFLKFLHKLENMNYLFQVQSVNVKTSQDSLGTAIKQSSEEPQKNVQAQITISFTIQDSK